MSDGAEASMSCSGNADPRAEPTCPVCGSDSTRLFARLEDRLFHAVPGLFTLRSCRNCHCIYQHPLPSAEVIATYYPETYWWGADRKGLIRKWTSKLEEWYREFVAMDHVRFLAQCSRRDGHAERALLDIGCGMGTILHLARRRGFQPFGMDISEKAVDIAKRKYGIDARQGSIGVKPWANKKFSWITMFHVLEHLANPLGALNYVAELLEPGGNLIVQVPNVASFQARLFSSRWYGLDVPRHLINFSPDALNLLMHKAGFEICRSARFSLRDNPASIASSLAPWLDPIGRKARRDGGAVTTVISELIYLGLFGACLPFALFESALGHGGTLWVHARQMRNAECGLRNARPQ